MPDRGRPAAHGFRATGIRCSEAVTPLAHRFVRDAHTALEQLLLDITQAHPFRVVVRQHGVFDRLTHVLSVVTGRHAVLDLQGQDDGRDTCVTGWPRHALRMLLSRAP